MRLIRGYTGQDRAYASGLQAEGEVRDAGINACQGAPEEAEQTTCADCYDRNRIYVGRGP